MVYQFDSSLINTGKIIYRGYFCCSNCHSRSPVVSELSELETIEEVEDEARLLNMERVEPKNRVLTLEELKAYCEGGADAAPLWYDSKNYSDGNRWMVIDLPKHAFGSAATVNCFVNGHFFEPTYGKEWRCWLRKPTKEEMEGTPWA